MRSSRFLMLAVAAVALAGCMQTGGPGPFSRNAPPLWQQDVQLPPMLRPAPVRTAQPSVIAQPAVVAQPLGEPMALQSIMPQVIAMGSEESGYALDSGDKLRVVVFGQDGLSASYSVDTSGSITMPLIGAVPARGRTPAQLQAAIGGRLRQGYVREPHVAVEVETYRPFFILGEVTLPGQYPYVANMTVRPRSRLPAVIRRAPSSARSRSAGRSAGSLRNASCRRTIPCIRATPSRSPNAGSRQDGGSAPQNSPRAALSGRRAVPSRRRSGARASRAWAPSRDRGGL